MTDTFSFSAIYGAFIAVSLLTIFINIGEAACYQRNRLSPAWYLALSCLQTLIWTAFLVLAIIGLNITGVVLGAILV